MSRKVWQCFGVIDTAFANYDEYEQISMQKLNQFYYQRAVSRVLVKLAMPKQCYFTHELYSLIQVYGGRRGKMKMIQSNIDHDDWITT